MEFTGKIAIVTGAASGMGLLAAQKLAERGAGVVLCDVNADGVEAAAEEIRANGGKASGVKVDVRNYEEIEFVVKFALDTYGRVDILINSAGGFCGRIFHRSESFKDLPLEVLDWGVEVNYRGPLYFSRAVIGAMIEQKSGVIINLGSIDGVTGSAWSIGYSAAKSGMIGLTKSLALYGAPHGVRACCVSPGPVMTRPAMANMKTPLGRAAEPIEVVELILYLCSEKAAFISGDNYLIDGARACGASN